MNELIEWLELEQAAALEYWQRASNDTDTNTDAADKDLSRYQRDYWSGYHNATANALHRLTGMGE